MTPYSWYFIVSHLAYPLSGSPYRERFYKKYDTGHQTHYQQNCGQKRRAVIR